MDTHNDGQFWTSEDQRHEVISSQKLRTLQMSEERFRLFIMASSDVVYKMSPDWSQMHYLTGKSFLLDTTTSNDSWLATYIPTEDQARVQSAIGEAISSKNIFELEHRVIRADGTTGWTHSRAVPYLDDQMQIIEWLGAAKDITARKQVEQALAKASQNKDKFLGLLAHELRNPLAVLSNSLLLLQMTGGNDQYLDLDTALSLMNREVSHLSRLVDDLLDISRINHGKTKLRLQPIDLGDLLREVIETTLPVAQNAKRQFSVVLADELFPLNADADRLTQVFRNLLNNAFKFTFENGRVWLSLKREGSQAVVRIADDGIGIPEQDLTRIFDLFSQVDSSRTRLQDGLGLGLALVKEFVQMHQGSITCQSAGINTGAEFTIYLPLLN